MPFATAIPREKARARASIADPDATVIHTHAIIRAHTCMYHVYIHIYSFIYLYVYI